jgi:hypothetical protein
MIYLERFERTAYHLALVLLLVAAARLGWVLVRQGSREMSTQKPIITIHRPRELPGVSDFPGQGSPRAISPDSINSAIAAAMASAKPIASAREYVKSYLSIQVGAPRSELRVDGLLVGRTPYVGQIGCERGRTVKIDLLPPKGMPKHYEIPCIDGEMRLRDEP